MKSQKLFVSCALFIALSPLCHATNPFLEIYNQKLSEIQSDYEEYQKIVKPLMEWIENTPKAFESLFHLPYIHNKKIYEGGIIAPISNYIDSLESLYYKKWIESLAIQYAWAIPNDEAIAAIQKYGPIIEIGAGNGYWASLIYNDRKGSEIIAFDNSSMTSYMDQIKSFHFQVSPGDHTQILNHREKTLFLCWPSMGEIKPVASESLKLYQGEHVIYVGELPTLEDPYPTQGDPLFFEMLKKDFQLTEEVKIPQWPGYRDKLYIYKRLPAASTSETNP